jgi:hypothetical protein
MLVAGVERGARSSTHVVVVLRLCSLLPRRHPARPLAPELRQAMEEAPRGLAPKAPPAGSFAAIASGSPAPPVEPPREEHAPADPRDCAYCTSTIKQVIQVSFTFLLLYLILDASHLSRTGLNHTGSYLKGC